MNRGPKPLPRRTQARHVDAPSRLDSGRVVIVDSDVHIQPASIESLLPYLDAHWREYIARSAFDGPPETDHPPKAPTTARPGTVPTHGPAGSDRALVLAQVFADDRVTRAVLTCAYALESVRNPYAAAALASAVNDWQIAEWLGHDPRLRAAIVVASGHPPLAAREIERVGDHPGFVAVTLPVRSAVSYGNLIHRPVHEAAVRHGLAVSLHFGGATGLPPTSTGWPSYFIEEYVGMSAVAQAQLTSLIVEGVFAALPSLRVVLAEVGFAWLPAWTWRADKDWRMLRREVPWVNRPPSQCVREHVRFTTAPLDGPDGAEAMARLIARDPIGMEDLLLYGTDYPHRHDDDADEQLLSALEPAARDKILHDNAHAWYRL